MAGLAVYVAVRSDAGGAGGAAPADSRPAATVPTASQPAPTIPTPSPRWSTPPPVAVQPPASPTALPTGPLVPAPTTGEVDSRWIDEVAHETGIGKRAVQAYATAALHIAAEQPTCGVGWNTIAGIGAVESGHGTYHGSRLDADGHPQPPIRGVALDGHGVAAVPDTDQGRWDGDTTWDRAIGPMQFIPSTWVAWAADGNDDGVKDPNQIDDAALAAARYLCASGPLTDVAGWRKALWSYNRSEQYAYSVATIADRYAREVQAGD
jgi:membrane-bound lytic murein transglycosylase B